ncbi:hypothetical protein CHS0354_021505 [Potamilus streckersoni]|uniref:Uncharacterized protein n=1 Tax=Potamilus streckersoni TaxID=2493646 RepID=A0AAE0SAI3_9BIVA|nr:hypothetical protein CHS0354_021505 [Potamilus streckersoni]
MVEDNILPICKDLTFHLEPQCIMHLSEQHSGVTYQCSKYFKNSEVMIIYLTAGHREKLEEPDIYLEEPFRNITNTIHNKVGKEQRDEKEKSFGKVENVNLEKEKGEMIGQKLTESKEEGTKKTIGKKENGKLENAKYIEMDKV